ncbi:MAG: nitrilase-related carbon-nitrogen hydrolase, partial [Bacteroidota bacterium]
KTIETDFGRLGGLICWEHWMPLSRQAMHEAGEDIHIALWPNVHELLQVASRAYAFEGRCFVLSVGQLMYARDLPSELEMPDKWKDQPDALVLKGGSSIIGPDGHYILGPVYEETSILVQKIDGLDRVYEERMALDTSGHYNRRDVFDFAINRKRQF